MHPFTILFVTLLVAGLLLRLWLLGRQIRAVGANRERVPAAFAGAISAEQHAKAADYTIALARFSRLHAVIDAGLLLLLTIGGGIAWIDSAIAGVGMSGLGLGITVIAAVALAIAILDLPFGIWRTFRIEARFGFNRVTPGLFAIDRLKGLAISAVLLVPLIALLLWLFAHAGDNWWLWAWSAWAVFSLLMSWAWPRLIAPLFNRFEPLQDERPRVARRYQLDSPNRLLRTECSVEPEEQ